VWGILQNIPNMLILGFLFLYFNPEKPVCGRDGLGEVGILPARQLKRQQKYSLDTV
jgi:hypothetical protein